MFSRMRLNWTGRTVACVAFLISCHAVYAQVGSIRGVVTDAFGAVIPDVEITVTNVASGVVQKATTNASGIYAVPFLNPGTYWMQAEKEGFAPATRDNLKLDVEQVARVDSYAFNRK